MISTGRNFGKSLASQRMKQLEDIRLLESTEEVLSYVRDHGVIKKIVEAAVEKHSDEKVKQEVLFYFDLYGD